MKKIIEIKDLTKYYGKDMGIEGVNLTVEKGEIFGFIGPNGSGKSTTIRALLGLIFKTSGEAFLFGKSIDNNLDIIRKDIGYLPGEAVYYDNMTPQQLLEYSASFYDKVDPKRIDYLIKKLLIPKYKKFEDLSFGNKKKVGIAQALLHSPKLLILDEPTSGLDPLMQNVFFELLEEEKKKGTTVFFSSHVLSEVKRMCDRVGIIKNGTVIKIETIHNLVKTDFCHVYIKSKELEKLKLPADKVTIKSEKENRIKFLYNGNSNDLIKIISKITVEEIYIEEPTIEEIFIHYYKEDK